MSLTIRPCMPADQEQLVEQFLQLNRFEDSIAHNRRLDRQGAIDALAISQKRVAETDGLAIVAELNCRVLGHLLLSLETEPAFVRDELRKYAYVSDLFVHEVARRDGVATALIEEAQRFARRRGVNRLTVSVLAGNSIAAALYAHLGFKPYSIDMTKWVGDA